MPATETASTARLAAISAKDIIARAKKNVGPVWGRLSADGQMVECKAVLCDDMLKDRAGTGLDWWLAVQHAVISIIIPE